jgi:hypothetical protein
MCHNKIKIYIILSVLSEYLCIKYFGNDHILLGEKPK